MNVLLISCSRLNWMQEVKRDNTGATAVSYCGTALMPDMRPDIWICRLHQ